MRIVSLTCSNTEIVHALGASDQLVGVDDHSDWPEDVVARCARVGPDLTVDLDHVASLRPDLVLASLTVPGHEAVVAGLVERGLPHLAPEPVSVGDVAKDIRTIGEAIGRGAHAQQVADDFLAQLEPADVPGPRPRILVEWWPRPVYTPGAQSWVTQLITLAGGINPLGDDPVKSRALDPAEVRDLAPDAIVVSWCGVPFERYRLDVVYDRPGWADTPAIRNRAVFPVPEAWLGRPGPRLVEGLSALKQVVGSVTHGQETP